VPARRVCHWPAAATHATPPPLPPRRRCLAVAHHPWAPSLPPRCCRFEEYVPLKKRRQMEEQGRLARLGRAPQPTSSGDTGGGGRGSGDDGEVVDHRQKESLLIKKAKQMQEVGVRRAGGSGRRPGSQDCEGFGCSSVPNPLPRHPPSLPSKTPSRWPLTSLFPCPPPTSIAPPPPGPAVPS
jgi:hypothetical protein